MDHFIEIRLLPDPEFQTPVLMNFLFGNLHRAFVRFNNRTIGVSFPDVESTPPTLGGRLRLHGSADDLRQLMSQDWVFGLRDHMVKEKATPVPKDVKYRVVRRVQAKSSPERLRRRLMRRTGIGGVEALERIPDDVKTRLNLPFVTIKSDSTSQSFRLFIQHLPLVDEPVWGAFGAYGLSPSATVPWF